jgi:hypothetical protein
METCPLSSGNLCRKTRKIYDRPAAPYELRLNDVSEGEKRRLKAEMKRQIFT